MLPTEVEDFPKPAAGEHQEPEGSRGKRIDLREAVLGFRDVLGVRFRFIHIPRDAGGFRFPDCIAKPLQLLNGQEAFTAAFLELVDTARGIRALWNKART